MTSAELEMLAWAKGLIDDEWTGTDGRPLFGDPADHERYKLMCALLGVPAVVATRRVRGQSSPPGAWLEGDGQ